MNLYVALWLGLPAAIGVTLGALPHLNARRLSLVAAIPVVLAAAFLVLWWRSAPTTYESGCECQEVYGHWLTPWLSVFVVAVPAAVWILGALVGVWARAIVDDSRAQRDRATS